MNAESLDGKHAARKAWIGVGAPILGLVLVTIVLAIGAFAGFSNEQDRAFERSSSRLVASAVDGRARAIRSVTLDYANWTEAYNSVTVAWRQRWVDDNIYSKVADGMLLMSADGSVRYAWFDDALAARQDEVQARAVRAVTAIPGLRALAGAATPAETVTHTMTSANGELLVVAVAPFSPEDDAARIADAGSNHTYMVTVDVLSADELAEMGSGLDLQGLAFTPGQPDAGEALVARPVVAANARQIGTLSWRHAHPGAAAFQARIWPVVFALVLVGALTLLIARMLVSRQIAAMAGARSALEASRAKSEFLARVSHELRTPLNAIIGYGELVQEETDAPETREDAGRIISAARHLTQLINDIIDQSRIDAERIKFNAEVLPVAGIVAEVHGLMRPLAKAAGVTLHANVDPAADCVFADHVRLRQCLLNLAGNAVKFSPGGEVTLHARVEAGERPMVVFEMRDNGIGIAADEMANIFRPFGQANPAISRTYGGTGLGLSIARDLARGMGGDLTVESAPGEGSTFKLTAPLATVSRLKAVA
jgi:signal transduction histidine kinase